MNDLFSSPAARYAGRVLATLSPDVQTLLQATAAHTGADVEAARSRVRRQLAVLQAEAAAGPGGAALAWMSGQLRRRRSLAAAAACALAAGAAVCARRHGGSGQRF